VQLAFLRGWIGARTKRLQAERKGNPLHGEGETMKTFKIIMVILVSPFVLVMVLAVMFGAALNCGFEGCFSFLRKMDQFIKGVQP
jgi:hypothetical protein